MNTTRHTRDLLSFLLGIGSFGLSITKMFQQRRLASLVGQLRQYENLLTSEINYMRDNLNQEIKIVKNVVLEVKHEFVGLQIKIIKSSCEWAY